MTELVDTNAAQELSDSDRTIRTWRPARLRVTREDCSLLADPPLAAAASLALENAQQLAQSAGRIQGMSLSELRVWARSSVHQAALRYTQQIAGKPLDASVGEHWIVDGHQPSLFHPGVWSKNFALGGVAHQLQLLADRSSSVTRLHLIIDSDRLQSRSLRVPTGSLERPGVHTIAFDDEVAAVPWEDAQVENQQRVRGFGQQATQAMQAWGFTPLIATAWQHAIDQLDHSSQLVDLLTAVRHRTEREWGLDNLEVRISDVCQTQPFLWFACELLARHDEFRELHNLALTQYRDLNGIRSQTHPVPELIRREDWSEAPFWVWRAGEGRRQRLFVRSCPSGIELADERHVLGSLPLTADGDAEQAVIGIEELIRRGLRLRTRALSTTLFARIGLADLFIHGIGGAKYDEMTDRLMESFFDLKPPGFQTVSGTVYLPIADHVANHSQQLQELRHRLRDLDQNPQRYLGDHADAEVQRLVAEKETLIAEQQAADAARRESAATPPSSSDPAVGGYQRYRRLKALNQQLRSAVEVQKAEVLHQLSTVDERRAASRILRDREYAFCLYPPSKLRPFLTRIATLEDETSL